MRINRHALVASAAVGLALAAAPVAANAQAQSQLDPPDPTRVGSAPADARSGSLVLAQAAKAPPRPPAAAKAREGADEGAAVEEVVVTGTSIRGLVAPVGSPTVSLDQAEVKASGATTMPDLLANIPQVNSFGLTPSGGQRAAQSANIPQLRNLPVQAGDGTLFLFNGARMVGGGFSTRPDPAVIPPGSVERVEVVIGGGSAVYGSDAVAGTINFILRKTLDGAEVRGTYGVADHYTNYDFSAGWGKVWDTGNFMVTANYAGHSNIPGSSRDFYGSDLRARGGDDFRSSFCREPNITISGVTYAYPDLAPNTRNLCEREDLTDLYPDDFRRSALVSFNQRLTDSISVSIDGYYSRRVTDFLTPALTASGTIRSTNPFFQRPPSVPGATSETLQFTFAKAFGDQVLSNQHFATWQIVPVLKWKLGHDWQATATVNAGYGDGTVHEPMLNTGAYTAALAGTTTATALNPYDPSKTNPAILAQIRDWNQYDHRYHEMLQQKLVFDGPLWELPGGTVRLAVGAERYYENQLSASNAGPLFRELEVGGIADAYGSRVVKSAFAEVVLPLVGSGNELPFVKSLIVNLSGRYDRYSDFGETTNPRIAATWEVVDGFKLRADYSTAFVAPTLNSMTKPAFVQILSNTQIIPPGGTSNRPSIQIQGGNPNLQPETATVYDVGFDWSPTFLPDLRVSGTYYYIDFRELLGGPNPRTFFTQPGWEKVFIVNPTPAQTAAFVGNLPRVPDVPLDFFGAPQIIFDSRTNNLGRVIASGIDFSVRYAVRTDYGVFSPAIAGTYGLRLDSANPSASPFVSLYDNGSARLGFTASLSYARGPVNARLSWDYRGGYPVTDVVGQTDIDAFQAINLFASYELPEGRFTSDTTLSINIDNLFDEPPAFQNRAGGFANGSAIGRYVAVSLQKKF